MRYFIELSYNGTNYCGWQRQPDAPTVQESIEKALSILLRTTTPIVGAGRTDTGVHASFYVAHFDFEGKTDDKPLDPKWLTYKLNILLPHDIAIQRIYEVAAEAHARFDATERQYTYIIEPHKNPFTRHTSWQYNTALDIEKMNLAAEYLSRHTDFTTFAKLGSGNATNICDVREARWERQPSGALHFTIRADRFLRNMIRAIVGTLVDVGRGRYTPEEFNSLVEQRDLSKASTGAPAQGLFLSNVKYQKP
ncbi:MAG: tRNA pseudouridine(38-40) synthase TruA [Rikenellaceae bacterium]